MSILVDEKTRVVVHGITGKEGTFHTKQMLAYGTVVAAGMTPGKKGQKVEGVPVFNSVHEAVKCVLHFCAAPLCCRRHYGKRF